MKSITLCLPKTCQKFIPKEEGKLFQMTGVRGAWGPAILKGRVLRVNKMTHGTLILAENLGFKKNISEMKGEYICEGWQILPIWISVWGPSGILCTWKGEWYQTLNLLMEMEEMNLSIYEKKRESQVQNSMAL